MNAANQIAQHLKIEVSRITRCEEWASCWFVVIQGKGSRFVSKKVVKMNQQQEITDPQLIKRLERVRTGKSNKSKFEQDLKSGIASICLGRDFGETVEQFYKRRPDAKKRIDERNFVLKLLEVF